MSPRRMIAGSLALAFLTFFIHGSVLDGWWLSDDPQVLVHALTETPATVLFSPPAWRYLSSSSFTPLVTISFDLDLWIGGLEPRVFYLHQLAMIAIGSILLFLLLAHMGRLLPAWLAAIAFLVAPATVLAAGGLMVRHYVEGLVLALAALLLWQRANAAGTSRGRGLLAAAAALAYLLAMLAKEFFAPLPLLMIWQARAAGASWRWIVIHLVPSALASLIYIGWRTWMLGSGGGYGGELLAGALAGVPIATWTAIVRPASVWFSLAVAAVVAVGLVLALRHERRIASGFLVAAGVFVFLPLAMLAANFEPRYGFVATVVLVSGVALATATTADPRWSALVVSLVVLLFASGEGERRATEVATRAIVAEGRYIWSQPGSASPILASSPGWYLAGLDTIRQFKGRTTSPAFFLSTDAIVLSSLSPDRFVRSVWGTSEIRPLDQATRDAIVSDRRALDPDAPLTVQLERLGNDIRWELGPREGRFVFLTVPYYGRFPIEPSGWRRIPEAREQQYFRIRREMDDGRWTVSPVFPLPANDGVVRWKR